MKEIYLLADYKGVFGSKKFSIPYRSGMDKNLLKKYFAENGYKAVFKNFSEIDFSKANFKDKTFLYTSSEDYGFYYKSYIEDVVYALSLCGAKVMPHFKLLRANNNKVFMEHLRDIIDFQTDTNIKSMHFGSLEELKSGIAKINFPCVIKPAAGDMSKNVHKAENAAELLNKAKKVSRTRNLFSELWDFGRSIRRKGYKNESFYRGKFIVQNFVPGLNNDWKVLIFGEKFYTLYRKNRDGDFRASGSGKFEFREDLPEGLLNFSKKVYTAIDVPNLSIDVAISGNNYFLIEFQAVYFGSTTIEKSPFYYSSARNKWEMIREKSILEKEYVNSVVLHLNKK